jgi:signal transduction histidine kinase
LIHIRLSRNKEPGFLTAEVRDNGPGIPQYIQQRIFEPFFTTKGRGKGIGLGLSVSQGIVEKLGGVLRCQSTLGEGTSFFLSLPTTDAPSEFMSGGEHHQEWLAMGGGAGERED